MIEKINIDFLLLKTMDHSGIIDENLCVWMCGSNVAGELGLGDRNTRYLPTKVENLPPIISLSIGLDFTLFLDDQGYVWHCGQKLSNFSNKSISIPEKFSNISNIVKISSCGHCLLLDNDGYVFTFGYGENGELGLGESVVHPYEPTLIGNIPKIKDIRCGQHYSILVDIEGNCWTFGINNLGQLGLGDLNNRYVPTKIENLPYITCISAGYDHSSLVDIDGNCWTFGSNDEGQLGLGVLDNKTIPTILTGLPKIKSSHCGDCYTILLDIDNNIWGFGSNHFGELQQNIEIMSSIRVPMKISFDEDIHSIISMRNGSIIINKHGQCFSHGYNRNGELGLGHTNNVEKPTEIQGLKAYILKTKRYGKTKSARN